MAFVSPMTLYPSFSKKVWFCLCDIIYHGAFSWHNSSTFGRNQQHLTPQLNFDPIFSGNSIFNQFFIISLWEKKMEKKERLLISLITIWKFVFKFVFCISNMSYAGVCFIPEGKCTTSRVVSTSVLTWYQWYCYLYTNVWII